MFDKLYGLSYSWKPQKETTKNWKWQWWNRRYDLPKGSNPEIKSNFMQWMCIDSDYNKLVAVGGVNSNLITNHENDDVLNNEKEINCVLHSDKWILATIRIALQQ